MKKFLLCALVALVAVSCKHDEPDAPQPDPTPQPTAETGFYLINQGAMGQNKASIDFYSNATSTYYLNWFATQNPTITLGLGDTGNDIKLYGNKLYATIMGSNLVEVMDANTGVHITAINLDKCRYISCYGGKVYVTSYTGEGDNGLVAEIDTTTLAITRTCILGKNPEEMAIIGGKMYIANSGGYFTNFDNRLSVVDLTSFTEEKKIEVAVNVTHIRPSADGKLYMASAGNYADIAGDLIIFDPTTEKIVKSFGKAISYIDICGTRCLGYSCEYDLSWNPTYNYYSIDTSIGTLGASPVTDGSESAIKNPYCITTDSRNNNFYICDASDYVSPGTIFCYSADGKLLWKQTTGDIPCAIAFK